MTEIKPNLLLVEDAPDMMEVAAVFLEKGGYQVIRKPDGKEAWEFLLQHFDTIDGIVSDVLMPEMDGYELCQNIRKHSQMNDIPVIFMSSLTHLDEKIKGYEYGADEYVTKPVSFEELNEKIKRILEVHQKNSNLKKQVHTSNSAALEAITYSSDLGQILNFYKTSLSAQNYTDLADNIFEITSFLGLKVSIIFMTDEGILFYSDSGKNSPLEMNILELARNKSRFYDFGTRTILNYPRFSVLIKNMPVDKPDRYGTLKDTLGAFGEAIEARVRALISDSLELKRNDIIATVDLAMKNTGITLTDVHEASVSAIDNMMADIEDAFITLGLTEQQEAGIREIVKNCLVKTNKAFEKSQHLLGNFQNIRNKLAESQEISSKK